ncbi:MAG TPA: hypothetical protein VE462_14320 [Propionibacteriaceae bacterium]|nr:hypothetical protein [Propionibacteriaceae bacterium]
MALTIGRAGPARSPARFEEHLGDARVSTGMAGQDPAGCRADVRTVEVATDTLHQLGHRVLREAGVRARSADLSAVEARFDALGQLGAIEATPVLRVGFQHLLYAGHDDLLAVGK